MLLIYILTRLGNFTSTIIAVNLEMANGYGLWAMGYSVRRSAPMKTLIFDVKPE